MQRYVERGNHMMAEERRLLGDGLVSSSSPSISTLVEAERRCMQATGSDTHTHALQSSSQGSPATALLLDPSVLHLFACSSMTMTGPPESHIIHWQTCSPPTLHCTALYAGIDSISPPHGSGLEASCMDGWMNGWQAQYRSSSGSGVGLVPSLTEESLLTQY